MGSPLIIPADFMRSSRAFLLLGDGSRVSGRSPPRRRRASAAELGPPTAFHSVVPSEPPRPVVEARAPTLSREPCAPITPKPPTIVATIAPPRVVAAHDVAPAPRSGGSWRASASPSSNQRRTLGHRPDLPPPNRDSSARSSTPAELVRV